MPSESTSIPEWTKRLFSSLDIRPADDLVDIQEKLESAANRLAPDSRRNYNLILLFQGTAVLAPLLWLVVLRQQWQVFYASYSVVLCTLLLVGISWWVRWRGMQHAWARSRMVAEIVRSTLITSRLSSQATVRALRRAPALERVAQWLQSGRGQPQTELPVDVNHYVKARIDDQLNYYQSKRTEAVHKRRQLSSIVTLCLDAALFLAAAGLAVSLKQDAARWLTWSYSDYILAFAGSALPLLAILAQMRGAYLELNRRVGRYAQQIEFLNTARETAATTLSQSEFSELVTNVESELLGEVVEWFYQAEHSEPYYRSKVVDLEEREWKAVKSGATPLRKRLWSTLEYSAGFVGRVLFGRVLVVALSVVLTTTLIHYNRAPEDATIQAVLRSEEGRLFTLTADGSYQLWRPDQRRANEGFLLIAHGLRDRVDISASGDHWMTKMEQALAERLGDDRPDIAVVDWHSAAEPSSNVQASLSDLPLVAVGVPEDARTMMSDLAMIRPQGERIGELVGFKLAREIRAGRLRRDRPMHLIGHSAGGFVVLHAALVLQELGMAPDDLRVTMLDTPMPVAVDIAQVASDFPVDFYRTSRFAQQVPADQFVDGFSLFTLTPPERIDRYMEAHSYAHQWFIDTIRADDDGIGFSRSEFSRE